MKISPAQVTLAAILCAFSFNDSTLAHENDPKLRDREPRYEGPGYRRATDLELRGAPAFSASGVTLLSWLPLPEFGNHASGNVCWGYVSPSGREYALMGLEKGTGFVEITNPANATIIAVMTGPTSLWRDIKTYQHYAYAVSEGGSGIQVFDLSQIDNGIVTALPAVTSPGSPTSTHTVAIDEVSGFLYRCGGSSTTGIRIYSLANPASPTYVASWNDRYVHEVQVVTYTSGPYAGKQIAFACAGFNGGSVNTGLDIIDVTNKSNLVMLATNYRYDSQASYSHQAWLSPDRQFLYLNDELIETNWGITSAMHVISVSDLTNPQQVNRATNGNTAITHNLYTKGNLIFASNYRSGLRVFDASSNPANPVETAYFDTYPGSDSAQFNGLWSNYPYFPSGVVIGSDLERGLFVWWVGPMPLNFAYPNGHPQNTGPDGFSLRSSITSTGSLQLEPSSVSLHYNDGTGWQSTPMTPLARNSGTFEASLSGLNCPGLLSYFVSASTTNGIEWRDPQGAPTNSYSSEIAHSELNIFADDFQTDTGWITAILGATAGAWQRGVPVNDPGWAYDPISDSDGSGQCYLTQNSLGNSDVDNGAVLLTSPVFDGSAGNLTIRYDYYLYLTVVDGVDRLLVEISNNGLAGPWVTAAIHSQNNGTAWTSEVITQAELDALGIANTSNMHIRFTANDSGTQSIVEAAIDAFSIDSADCEEDLPTCPQDIVPPGGDGQVTIADINSVIAAFGITCNGCPQDIAPPGGDGQVTIADITAALSALGPCPR